MAHLKKSPLSFIPLPPPNLRPFGAPPSIGRRECPREPLPLEGAAERIEAGLASFLGGEAASSLTFPLGKVLCREKRHPRIAAFPLGEGGPRQRRSGALVNDALKTIFFALFHTASPIQPPPLRGTSFQRKEGVTTRAPSFGRGCRAHRGGVGFLFGRRSRCRFSLPP